MQILKKYRIKDLCEVLEMSFATYKKRMEEPATFTIAEIENLVKFGVDRDELINEICEVKK